MIINNTLINVSLEQVLNDLKFDLDKEHSNLFSRGFKNSNDNIMIQCPYHKNGQEKRPSAGIKKSDGTFHCFTCGETHSLPEVISYCFGKQDLGGYGWSWLVRKYKFIEVKERKDVKLHFSRNRNSIDGHNAYISEEELDSYRYIHPYMYKRKLTDEIIEMFDIGYDKETQCITFPVRNIGGKTLFIARRSVNYKYFNYPSGVEKPLYGIYELYLCDYPDGYEDYEGNWREISHFPLEVIVCESMLDALTCWVYGKYAVAMNGLGTELQFKQLRDLPCRKLILATDNDEAGMKARKRIRENVKNKIITEYILPEGRKDINELSREEFDNLEEVF